MWECEGIEEVSTILILFQGPLRGTANLGELLEFSCTAPKKEGNSNLESMDMVSGVRNDSYSGWIGKQKTWFKPNFLFYFLN